MICLLLFLSILKSAGGTNCFYCVSPDKQYNATIRRQLATQTDVFFYPIGVKTMSCSNSIDAEEPVMIESQICSKYSMCVTLFPNLENTTFVVRGCFENILRHTFREDINLHEPGCFLVRSLPIFTNTIPMDYIICTCEGDYCNVMQTSVTVPRPYSFASSNILKLTSDGQAGSSLYISSARYLTFGVASFVFLIQLVFS